MRSLIVLSFTMLLLTPGQPALARRAEPVERIRTVAPPAGATDNPALAAIRERLFAAAVQETTWLHSASFDGGALCNPMGWTSIDLTQQAGDYWHVEAYTGLPFGPIEGFKSLWCGLRPAPETACTYVALPGYGNGWNQSWCTKACLSPAGGATSNLDVSFALKFESEPSYDAVSLEYTQDCSGNTGWQEIDGGNPEWTGIDRITVNRSYNVNYPLNGVPVKVRLRFASDTAWSDQDGFFPTVAGAAHIDSLQVETLPMEFFEDEAAGATSANDWQSCNTPGHGDHAMLLRGSDVLQDDPCATNISCLWAFIKDSTANFACGGHPEQAVVPYGNVRHEYISNEIWSPLIPVSGGGSLLKLQFDVYRDLPQDALIFYQWHARTIENGCPTPWKDRNFLHNGTDGWYRQVEDIGAVLNLTNATHLQVAIGTIDMCPFWCGTFGTGQCHTHAPLIDNVRVFRVDSNGPHWEVRDIDTFQDTFSTNGTITGTARADMARNISTYWGSSTITPGDSAIVQYIVDPLYAVGAATNSSGLSNDPDISSFVGRHKTKKQIYMWVKVWPSDNTDDPGDKVGADLSEGPGGQANRYPFAGTQMIGNDLWTKVRMDYTYSGTATNPGWGDGLDPINARRFNVDLNDNLFTPGDTVCYFFGATSPSGTTYWSYNWRATDNIAEVAANPMEFTVLPAGAYNRGGDILYVDGADGLGVQPYYDGAFMAIGIEEFVDRYDVRGPSSAVANRLAGRVSDVALQLNACYNAIIWDTGSLAVTLGDGSGNPEKSNDWALLNTFLSNLTSPGGVILMGDDIAETLTTLSAPSAITFRSTYMPFNLASGDHQSSGLGVSPAIVPWPGRLFGDTFTAFGGCPEMNGFDVLNASGTSLVQMSYNAAQSSSGAVLHNANGNARVVMAGFSLAFVRDDETDGISDRAKFIRDALSFGLGDTQPPATGAGPLSSNSLSQNYPNPFNPATTIAFSLKARGHVEINVYDVGGRLVRTLAGETRSAGLHTVTWDGRDDGGSAVASGVYFYRLVTPGFTQTKKMVLLK